MFPSHVYSRNRTTKRNFMIRFYLFQDICQDFSFIVLPLSSFCVGWKKGSSETLILEFTGRSDRKNARLLHKFTSMGSVTVCTRLRFDPNCSGISTIFSYSIQSCINEFQLHANLIQGKPVQLALLVHGIRGAYQEAFKHDGSWHSVCVSWSQNGGHWELFIDGRRTSRNTSLNISDSIGPDGFFIIGQEYDIFGGSFKKDQSFSGSITELHIWDRVLNSSEIDTMEKECSPLSSGAGLVFKWGGGAMEIESSLKKQTRENPCQGTSDRMLHWDGKELNSYTV